MSSCDHELDPAIMASLAARRRRSILDYLLNAETGQVSLEELVDHVVEEETHSPSPDRQAVAVSLHHRHLPKLADEGFIEYESERGSVTTTAETERTEPYLEFARRWESEPAT